MKGLMLAFVIVIGVPAPAMLEQEEEAVEEGTGEWPEEIECTRCCYRGQSQPCGNSCIEIINECHQPPGNACYCDWRGNPQ